MIKRNATNRSRRLRKKLYVEEFQVLGFNIDLKFVANSSEDDLDSFFEDFLDSATYQNGLIFGGGGTTEEFSGFIIPMERYKSATEDDRKLISDWLKSNSQVESVEIGELQDANADF
ncbi:YggL family protein [Sansalvadorimonas sp. 2012CJ34-2]|uniref:YggL family protein n=1 Tax=Parendozoicomonas callyspongiae TaxID=2942213 RepID=A0ABT0PCQ3_9GAMM|nr:YggL family protein [Sansalvadorimonas sp. 2012CJ34-2]MCL6269163.1 YggL family protein [Sansalvadorimonas sp. 2012CJ34-2]